ncbi:MAG: hypothetical protein WDA16_08685 [Candidatus Thermoplasmatota archaeon]
MALITWTPGTQLADSYNIYGISADAITFVGVGSGGNAPVMGGYTAYAVSGVLGGVESQRVTAAWLPCIEIDTGPPPGWAIGWCELSGAGVPPAAKTTIRSEGGMPHIE